MVDLNHPCKDGFNPPKALEDTQPNHHIKLFFPPFQSQNMFPHPTGGTSGPSLPDDHSPLQKRHRRNSPQSAVDEIIPPPFAWATNRPATVHTIRFLLDNNISTISGEVQCKRCDARCDIELDLESKFWELKMFIMKDFESLNQRAPKEWMNPKLPDCKECKQRDCMKPVISPKHHSINWLFLLLGNLLGCCTLEQLKYFCMHTKQHRTGAKDRVLFTTYVMLCKQLDPEGSFVPRNG